MYSQMLNTGIDEINNLNITSINFIPTREYQDVFRRQYEVSLNSKNLSNLEEVVQQQLLRGNKISSVSLANATPDIFKMSDLPGNLIGIANGWNTVRLRFRMVVESTIERSDYISYIQGFTDYHDPSMFGTIDPNMPMHINSITNVIRTLNVDNTYSVRVHSSFNILADPYNLNHRIEDTTASHRLLRPKDIADGIDITSMYNGNVGVFDRRSAYGLIPQESKRSNGIAAQHVSDVFNSYIYSKEMTGIGYDVDDLHNYASTNLTESNLNGVPFIDALSSITGRTGTVDFTLNTLTRIKPNLEEILMIADNTTPMISDRLSNNILDTNYTESLASASIESTIANTLSEAVSSLLADELLSTIDFSITNMSVNSELIFIPTDAKSFIQGLDARIYVDRFMNKLKSLVMPAITRNNLIGLNIYVHGDILGETTIAVGIGSNPLVVYRLPTFCNSLYSPVVGTDSNYSTVIEDFSHMLQLVGIDKRN